MVRQGGLGMRGRAPPAERRVALNLPAAAERWLAAVSQVFSSSAETVHGPPSSRPGDHLYDAPAAILAEMMRSGSATGSPRLILSTFPMPSVTCPQTVYLPLRKGASAKQMKNWLSAESGDCARAIDTVPRRWGSLLNSALSFLPEPPVPVPWGQPVCAMNPSMTR